MHDILEKIIELWPIIVWLTALIGGIFHALKKHLKSFIEKVQDEKMQNALNLMDEFESNIYRIQNKMIILDKKIDAIEKEWQQMISDFKNNINLQFDQTREDIRDIKKILMSRP